MNFTSMLPVLKLLSDPYLSTLGGVLYDMYPYASMRFYQNGPCESIDPYAESISSVINEISNNMNIVNFIYETACMGGSDFTRTQSFYINSQHTDIPITAQGDYTLCNMYRYYETCDKHSSWSTDGTPTWFGNVDQYIDIVSDMFMHQLFTHYQYSKIKHYNGESCQPDSAGNIFDMAGTGVKVGEDDWDIRTLFHNNHGMLSIFEEYTCDPKCAITHTSNGQIHINDACMLYVNGVTVPIAYNEGICKIHKGIRKCVTGPELNPPKEEPIDDHPTQKPDESDNNTSAIVGGVVGGIAGIVIICACCWFGYKWYSDRQGNNENVEA